MHLVVRYPQQLGATAYKAPLRYEAPRNVTIPTEVGYYKGPIPGDVREIPRTPPPPPPPATSTPRTSTTPTSTPNYDSACTDLWGALLGQSTVALQNCINTPAHRSAFNTICNQIARGQLSQAAGAAQWAHYVAQACPPPPTGVPPYTTVVPNKPPPVTTTTPDVPPGVDVPRDDGGDPGVVDVPPAEESGYLRQVGSVVGIGLILAVGLTYARKKGMFRKLTKRRGRR